MLGVRVWFFTYHTGSFVLVGILYWGSRNGLWIQKKLKNLEKLRASVAMHFT